MTVKVLAEDPGHALGQPFNQAGGSGFLAIRIRPPDALSSVIVQGQAQTPIRKRCGQARGAGPVEAEMDLLASTPRRGHANRGGGSDKALGQ